MNGQPDIHPRQASRLQVRARARHNFKLFCDLVDFVLRPRQANHVRAKLLDKNLQRCRCITHRGRS